MITQDILNDNRKDGLTIKEICLKHNISQYMYYKIIKSDINHKSNKINTDILI